MQIDKYILQNGGYKLGHYGYELSDQVVADLQIARIRLFWGLV